MNDLLREAIAPLPTTLATTAEEIIEDEYLGEGVDVMLERDRDFSSPTAALLAGIGMMPESRQIFEEQLDYFFTQRTKKRLQPSYEEVVIGGGLHAAIYCAVRRRMGKPAPLVLEKAERVGGAFAVSRGPSFYLNSRNRPGSLSVPGRDGGLNVLPGALVQPADLSTEEYQTNWAVAFSIRTSLAAFGDVHTGCEVAGVEKRKGTSDAVKKYPIKVKMKDSSFVYTKRVVIVTGLGTPISFEVKSDRFMSFSQFMTKMDERFPLQGMKRVAVIGGGDSAKTAIEALTGQGPQAGWSVASLDWPNVIDWYGCPQTTCEDWMAYNRTRYKRIGPLLRPDQDGKRRVVPKTAASRVAAAYDQVYVDEQPYDTVIECLGYNNGIPITLDQPAVESLTLEARICGRYYYGYNEGDLKRVISLGPASGIPLSTAEQRAYGRNVVPENATALFRYASRTAAVAASLD